MSQHPHEPDELEPDPSVPPRPEEEVADAGRQDPAADPVAGGDSDPVAGGDSDPVAGGDSDPVAGGQNDDPPAQGEGRPDSH